MKSLAQLQIISFVSRGIAMILGLVQGIFVLRFLSVEEYGVVGVVASIGSVIGVTQHLGLASGSTREIAGAEHKSEVFKIFVTSVFIRYIVTVPLAAGLFLFSDHIATRFYNNPNIILPLKIYAGVLLFQGVQSILNSVISGTQRFKALFIYQSAIALVSVILYIPLVYLYKVDGYFLAFLLFNIIASVVLGIVAFYPLRSYIQFPTNSEISTIFKGIFSVSMSIFIVKIIYTFWQRSGPLFLEKTVGTFEVGLFNFALFYATKLMLFSDAITDVNLPVLSKDFKDDLSVFKKKFSDNFDKVFALIVFASSTAVFWLPEIVQIAVGSDKYNAALPLVFPLILAFMFYSFINILKSSVLVPANLSRPLFISYFLLFVGTAAFYMSTNALFGPLTSFAYSMAVGSLVSVLYILYVCYLKMDFTFINVFHVLLLVHMVVLSIMSTPFSLFAKIPLYLSFSAIYVGILYYAGFFTHTHIQFLQSKINFIKSKHGK